MAKFQIMGVIRERPGTSYYVLQGVSVELVPQQDWNLCYLLL